MGVPVCRRVSTILAIWSVFRTKAKFTLVREKDPACQTVPVLRLDFPKALTNDTFGSL